MSAATALPDSKLASRVTHLTFERISTRLDYGININDRRGVQLSFFFSLPPVRIAKIK